MKYEDRDREKVKKHFCFGIQKKERNTKPAGLKLYEILHMDIQELENVQYILDKHYRICRKYTELGHISFDYSGQQANSDCNISYRIIFAVELN